MSDQCDFIEAWIGRCPMPATTNGKCDKHAVMKCASCDAPATHTCDETFQFVCGAPLCGECEHTIHENGTNGGLSAPPEGMKSHCRKTEQRFKPWYLRAK